MVYLICCLPLESESEVAQSCRTLCDPMDCNPQNFPGSSTGVGRHFLLQGIFLTQRSNLSLPHCRQRLYLWATRGALLALNESNHTYDCIALIIHMKSGSSSFLKLGNYSIFQDNFHIIIRLLMSNHFSLIAILKRSPMAQIFHLLYLQRILRFGRIVWF